MTLKSAKLQELCMRPHGSSPILAIVFIEILGDLRLKMALLQYLQLSVVMTG